MTQHLQQVLNTLPKNPGVYKMFYQDNHVIYIGKAKNLKKRVSSYFKKSTTKSVKTEKMVSQITDIQYLTTKTELEAILLETNLIKEIRPKYNILMKDDKNFSYIKVTVQEDYPRILIVRKVLKDGAKYFGPKTAAHQMHSTLNLLRKILPYRNCNLQIEDQGPVNDVFDKKRKVKVTKAGIKYPCLDLHIKRCVAPCIGKCDITEYRQIIDSVIDFLSGKHEALTDNLKQQMQKAAAQKQYEKAAKIRDKINSIDSIFEKQIITAPNHASQDIVNFYTDQEKSYFTVLQVREGKIIDTQNIEIKSLKESSSQILTAFLHQFYSQVLDIPKEIILPSEIEDISSEENILTELANHKVKLQVAAAGKKNQLLDMCLENAKNFANLSRTKWESNAIADREEALQELGRILKLPKKPKRIECYDISHLSGTNTVASMSVFEKGYPKKDQYRHFKIDRELSGNPDDFASMTEVIFRRLKYLSKKNDNFSIKKVPRKTDFKVFEGDKLTQILKIKTSNKLKSFISTTLKPLPNEAIDLLKEKLKSRRIYFKCKKTDQDHFIKIGALELRKMPEDFDLKKTETALVFDTTKDIKDKSFAKTPDLIVIDGGKGQLSAAHKVTKDYQLKIPVISIAKKQEEIFVPGQKNPIILNENDSARHILQHIRDEAHRFAIEYNRKLRKNDYTVSSLENIGGIGKMLAKKLLRKFGSIENLKLASEDEIAEEIGTKKAIIIKKHLF